MNMTHAAELNEPLMSQLYNLFFLNSRILFRFTLVVLHVKEIKLTEKKRIVLNRGNKPPVTTTINIHPKERMHKATAEQEIL